DVDSFLNQFGN
ncbi:hypothetical protein MG3_03980, partial [Candida albicans P78048]